MADIPCEPKRSGNTASIEPSRPTVDAIQKVLQSSSRLDTPLRTDKILSKVRSAKDNITRLFKTSGRVFPEISSLGPVVTPSVHQRWDAHTSPLLASISQSAVSRVCAVAVVDSLPSGQIGWETIVPLVACSEHEEHVEDFVFILRSVVEIPSPSSSLHLLTAPHRQRIPLSTFLLNQLHTNEEQLGCPKVDAEGVQMEASGLFVTDSCVPLRTSDSEAKYDAMLAAEFATFSFDSDDILEWSDEVEREKQARMDAHFAYVSNALAVPVPKLSTCFSVDSPADFINVDTPLKTETSDTNTSSADSSLVASIDAEESQPSPMIVRGLRRVGNHGDLRNLHLTTDYNDSCSDLSCWSLELGLSDSTAIETKTGALRRSVKCNDLRKSFSSLEPEIYHSARGGIKANKN